MNYLHKKFLANSTFSKHFWRDALKEQRAQADVVLKDFHWYHIEKALVSQVLSLYMMTVCSPLGLFTVWTQEAVLSCMSHLSDRPLVSILHFLWEEIIPV